LTLLEVLLAAVVLGVALLGIAGAFPAALRTVTAGGQITQATLLAQQMLEAIRIDPSDAIPRYAGKDARGVHTEAPANFPDDWPWPCAEGWTWAGQFCGKTKLTRWRQDLARAAGAERGLARVAGDVRVMDHERPVPGGGGAISGATTLLRITVTVTWDTALGRRHVTLTSTVACARAGCT
jgi:Tfp pilus assembly protein PilV